MQLFKSPNVSAHSQASRSGSKALAGARLRGAAGGESLSNLAFHVCSLLETQPEVVSPAKRGAEGLIWRREQKKKRNRNE